MMTNEPNFRPCELVLKVGCNESEEISTALTSLLRSCSIDDEKIFLLERQIQPTSYFNSFTNQLSTLKTPFPCQSLSCVILLTDELFFQQQEKSDFFKSNPLWTFHHKIELINDYREILARQDYYELSHLLPLWSISHIPSNKYVIIRFNIFTTNFDLMVRFYENLFQRKPDCSKMGFVLYHLSSSSSRKGNLLYQFSIKYSPSIQSYSISHSSHLKFYLANLTNFLHQYSSKLFRINSSEYYIYDPDGNLLHLHLQQLPSTPRETLIPTNDSGFGDSSSDPTVQPMKHYLNRPLPSSHDSGQCSSISSNEIPQHSSRSLPKPNGITVRTAKKSEIDYRLKQQQRSQLSIYESEPRLSNLTNANNRYYSSMNNMQSTPALSLHRFKSSVMKRSDDQDREISYEVDSPRASESSGYLKAFLLKKQQQSERSSRPKSASSFTQPLSFTTKPNQNIPKPISSQSSKLRSKSATFEWQNASSDDGQTNDRFNPIETSRINIGITLDSRLRKTPVLDMLRSTAMQRDALDTPRFNRTFSLRHSSTPIARF